MGENQLYLDYQAPNLNYQRVWSATEMYYAVPTAATYAGGTVTVTSKNHNLASGDTVSFVSTVAGSAWNVANVVATVVNKDTFTVPFGSNPGTFPDRNTSLSTEKVIVTCTKYSRLMFKPTIIQFETVPAGVTVEVQSKIHPDASWKVVSSVTSAGGVTQVTFSPLVNLVRCAITVGTGQPTVYAQYTVY